MKAHLSRSCSGKQTVNAVENIVDIHTGQGGIRNAREQGAPAQVSDCEGSMRARRRPPLLRRGWAEKSDGGPRESTGQMRGTGISRDDDSRASNDRRIFQQSRGPRSDTHRIATLARHESHDVLCSCPFGIAAREKNCLPAVHEMVDDGGEPVCGPMAAAVGRSGVHDTVFRSSSETRDVDGGDCQAKVRAVPRDSVMGKHRHPAVPLMHVLDPLGPLPSLRAMPDSRTGVQLVEPLVALRSFPVQVDSDIDRAGSLDRRVEARRGKEFDIGTDEADERFEPGGRSEHDPVFGEVFAQGTQRGHGDEEISELQSTKHKHDRSAHGLSLPGAVLFDRDNTLIVDVPYSGNPDLVEPMPGARATLDRIRSLGIPVGVITNQSGVGHGFLTRHDVDRVNARVEELLGPFDVWQVCPHTESDGCSCRKPSPKMLLSASESLGVSPARVVYIGDIGADMETASAAGARGVLVPTSITLSHEVETAETVCASLAEAIDLILSPPPHSKPTGPDSPLQDRQLAATSSDNPSSPGPLEAPSPPDADLGGGR